MIESLFYKEWIKSRWVLLIVLIAHMCVITYTFMIISQNMRVGGYNKVWELIVLNGATYFGYLKYLPLIAGIILGLVQYVPEVINKRFKLTLHLPMAESRIMLTMLVYGVVCLTILFLLSYIAIGFGVKAYFPHEVATWELANIQPWLWGGLASYLLTAWICLEPVWKQRVFNAVIAVLGVSLFYFTMLPKAYTPLLPFLIILVALFFAFSYHSLLRFKDGEQ